MTNTPLKTAARMLSLAILIVAGFTIWGVCSRALRVPTLADFSTPQPVMARATNATKPHGADKSVEAKSHAPMNPAPSKPLDDSVKTATKPKERAAATTQAPPAVFTDVTPPSLSDVSVSQTQNSQRGMRRGIPRIQPELGRPPIEVDPPAIDERLPAPRATTVAAEPSSSARLNSRLASLQRQVDQLAQAEIERQTDELENKTQRLQQLQQEQQLNQVEQRLKNLIEKETQRRQDLKNLEQGQLPPLKADKGEKTSKDLPANDTDPAAESEQPEEPKRSGLLRAEPIAGQPERFSIQFQDAEIGEALSMLGQLSGLNILVGRGVAGRVPAVNLQDVTAEQALTAITKSLDYVYERDEHFVFVSTAMDAQQRKQALRKTTTKIYRPKYISVKELQALITPLMTKGTGLIAITNPSDTGLESSRTKAGGDSLAQTDAVLIVDYPEVIAQIDAIMAEIDVPPSQVVIEAMILSVKLDESMKMGVNFALINDSAKHLVVTGSGAALGATSNFPGIAGNIYGVPPAAAPAVGAGFTEDSTGLKYGFIQGEMSGFVEALETLTDTSVLAAPSVRVLNKQRAELIIGRRLGYKTSTFNGTQTIENINFLEVGTKLFIRPYIANDGLVRMELHPERSDGIVKEDGLPESQTTEVTSNVMVREGTTVVIGGLIEETAVQSQSRVPVLGALPVIGNLFRNKADDMDRTELIVLITPRIIRDLDTESEGGAAQHEHERRHEDFRERMSPITRRHWARTEYERAAQAFEQCEYNKAKVHIEQSLRHNRNDVVALRLRDQIDAVIAQRTSWFRWPSGFRRKPPEAFHRVASDPAIFTEDLLVPTTPSNSGVAPPPAPAAATFDIPLPAPAPSAP